MAEKLFTNHKVEVRSEGDSKRITGLAAVFYDGTRDTEYDLWYGVKERIMPTAFDRAIEEKDDVRGLFNHDPDNLLGRTVSGTMTLAKEKAGLRYTIEPGATTIAANVIESIRRGDLSGSSFAFFVDEELWRHEEDDVDVREILSVRLFDVGPVTYPAYESTTAGLRAVGGVDEARSSHIRWKESPKFTPRGAATARARMAVLGL